MIRNWGNASKLSFTPNVRKSIVNYNLAATVVDQLARINHAGMLTYSSQDGKVDVGDSGQESCMGVSKAKRVDLDRLQLA